MPYIITLAGILIIFIALKDVIIHKKKEESSKTEISDATVSFKGLINKEIITKDEKNIYSIIDDLTVRVDNIENSLLMLYEELGSKNNDKISSYIEQAEEKSEAPVNYENDIDNDDDGDGSKDVESNINEIIYKLYDSGKGIDEICSSLQTGKGEVLLRLGLRKQVK